MFQKFFVAPRCGTPQNDSGEVPCVMLRIPPLAGAEASQTQWKEMLSSVGAGILRHARVWDS